MNINGLSVVRVDGGYNVTTTAFLASNEELSADDMAAILDAIRSTVGPIVGAQAAPAASPTPGRRSRAGSAPTAEATPSTPTAEAGPTTRRRRGAADAADAAPASEPTPSSSTAAGDAEPRRRRRGSTEPAEPAGITDEDLLKACSAAGEVITPAVVKQILKEDYGLEAVNKLKPEDRQKFLEELDAEVAAAKEDK